MVLAFMVLAITFALVIAIIVLRFGTITRQLFDSMALNQRERAEQLDRIHSTAFTDAMTALEQVNQRIVDSQTQMLTRTFDMVAGPQAPIGQPAVDNPTLDARPPWKPDDEYDYSGIGLDPTDDTLPDPPLEPEDNEHRAVMLPPGQGLIPNG